jgi:hypothetical protein
VVRARNVSGGAAVKEIGYVEGKVARFLGVTTPTVNRLAASPELPGFRKYLKAL